MASMLHFTTTISLKKWTLCSHIKSSSMCTLLFSKELSLPFLQWDEKPDSKAASFVEFLQQTKEKVCACSSNPSYLIIFFENILMIIYIQLRRKEIWIYLSEIFGVTVFLWIFLTWEKQHVLCSPHCTQVRSQIMKDTTSHLICLPEAT